MMQFHQYQYIHDYDLLTKGHGFPKLIHCEFPSNVSTHICLSPDKGELQVFGHSPPQNPVPHSALSHSLEISQIQVFPEHISVSLSQVLGHSPPQNPVPHSALSHSLETSQIQVFPEHTSVSLSQVFGHAPPHSPVPQSASLHSFATSQTHVFPEHTSVAPHVEGHSFPQAPPC